MRAIAPSGEVGTARERRQAPPRPCRLERYTQEVSEDERTPLLSIRRRVLLILLWLIAPHARASDEEFWYAIYLEGRKIGTAHAERRIDEEGGIRARMRMELAMERNGVRIGMATQEEHLESADGRPLALAGETIFGGQSLQRYEGEIRDGKLRLRLTGPAGESRRELVWPEGATLSEGLRRALSGLEPGATAMLSLFVGDLLEPVPVRLRAIDYEAVELPELGAVRLLRVEQQTDIAGHRLETTLWTDERGAIPKMSMPLLGSHIELLACSRACAEAPSDVGGLFERSLAPAPEGTAGLNRRLAWIYEIRSRDGGGVVLPASAEQRARRAESESEWIVEVRPGQSAREDTVPGAQYLAPNRWIESDHEEIVRFARAAVPSAASPAEAMKALEAAVAKHIRDKSLAVGYASALETLRSRSGDCTEHALLLAAAGRALGIPTRVATGLVFSPAFGEAREVFVPHAWTQAWIDQRWISFDAAQNGFGGGHLLLATGDGDPWRFAEGIAQLGRLDIIGVREAAEVETRR
ncbi:MAG: hypothetical protein KatS3mg125_1756 [Lysobacterales bacterium]|nr:MAG: hypothetical protein KatS3mg125_1756 [Xanthomonadales bacterium]